MAKTQSYRGKTGKDTEEAPGNESEKGTAVAPSLEPSTDEALDAETQQRYERAKKSDLTLRDLQKMSVEVLHDLAKNEGVENYTGLKKQDLIFQILKSHIAKQGLMYGEGVLEILPDGFGFLRSPEYSYLACPDDIYVSPSQIRRFGLKPGHIV